MLDFETMIKQKSQINYQMYEGDLDQFTSFAYIFPFIFWVMSFSIISIILRRTIMKEHKYIGVMQAIGQTKGTIIKVYLVQFVILGLVSSFIGCVLSMPVGKFLVIAFKSMIELPHFEVFLYPRYWIFSMGVSTLGCIMFSLFSMFDTVNKLPHQAMQPKMPKIKRKGKRKQGNILSRVSFNTRYSLTTAMRNKGRFVVMVIGLAASTGLLVFSIGFRDSLRQTVPDYFRQFANYELIVETTPTPLANEALNNQEIVHQDKALQLPVEVEDEDYMLVIVDKNVHTLNLSNNKLKEGIVIPEYYAEKWEVSVGDLVEVNKKMMRVSQIIPLGMGLSIFTSFDYASEVFETFPQVYNSIYVQTNELNALIKELEKNNSVFSTAQEDKESFNEMLDSVNVLIMLLMVCGVILGMTVISCMNMMNLASREFEYMFMNIMGYSKGQILLTILKETVIQLVISLPLGMIFGYQLILLIKGEFSQNAFTLYPHVAVQSYVIVAVMVVIMSLTRLFTSNRFLNQLAIVEGLKIQED